MQLRLCDLTVYLCVFHLFNDCGESLRVVEGEIGEDFAVDFDTALVDEAHELGVAEVVHAGGGVDTLDPDGTHVAFFVLAVAIGVGKTFFPGVLSDGPYIAAAAEVATGKFEDFLAAGARCNVVD